MKKITFILAITFGLIFTSCKKDKIDTPSTSPESMEELVVPATFDWKTTKDIQLTLTGNTAAIVEVASTQGIAYQKAYLTANQPYMMKLTVPTFETKVRLRYMGQDINLDLSSNTLSYTFQ